MNFHPSVKVTSHDLEAYIKCSKPFIECSITVFVIFDMPQKNHAKTRFMMSYYSIEFRARMADVPLCPILASCIGFSDRW